MADNKSKNFTVKNGIYRGQVEHNLTHYKSFGELMWITIKNHDDKIAQLDARTEETVTYAELQNKVVRCALWMQKYEIKSDDIISICTGNHLNYLVPCLSATYINAIFNPWNENLDLQTMSQFLKLMTPKMIFCSEKSANIVLSAVKEQNCNTKVVVFGKHIGAISFSDIVQNYNNAEVANFRYVELDDIKKTACIMHSSGTTGMPKGIELSNYVMLILSHQRIMNMTNVSSHWYSPLYWMTEIMMSFNGIMQGTKAIIYPEFDEENTCRLIEKYNIQAVFLNATMIYRLSRSDYIKKYLLPSLKVVISSGATVKPKVQEELRRILSHVQILQCYGMTELGGIATLQLPNGKNGSCGKITKNVQMKVLDPKNGNVLGPNQPGEICIKLPTLMSGYYKNPEATRSRIDQEGWLHSGDIGYIDEDEEWFVMDRIMDLIKYGEYQLFPGEIEKVLLLHPAVLEAAVIGVPHTTEYEHPIAFIIKRPGAKVTEQELIDFVAKNVVDHYRLRAGVKFVDKFPCNISGKILKRDLRAMTKKFDKTQ